MSIRNNLNNLLELVNVLLQHATANTELVNHFVTPKTLCFLVKKWYDSQHKVLTFIWVDQGNMIMVALQKRHHRVQVVLNTVQGQATPLITKLETCFPKKLRVFQVPCLSSASTCFYMQTLLHLALAMEPKYFKWVKHRSPESLLNRIEQTLTADQKRILDKWGLRGGAAQELKVVSWNAHNNFVTALGMVLCVVNENTPSFFYPDVICLQEVTNNVLSTPSLLNTLLYVPFLHYFVIQLERVDDRSFLLRFYLKQTQERGALVSYRGFLAEQSMYGTRPEYHYKNLYMLIKQKASLVIRDSKFIAIKKCILPDTKQKTKDLLQGRVQYPSLAASVYFNGVNEKAKSAFTERQLSTLFTNLDAHFESLPAAELKELFPQYCCLFSQVKEVPPIRKKRADGTLVYHQNLWLRGVLCVVLENCVLCTFHNIRHTSKTALYKYVTFLQQTFQLPFILIGDFNIDIVDLVSNELAQHFLERTNTQVVVPEHVTSKNNKTIDYMLHTVQGLNVKHVDAVSVLDTLSCQPSAQVSYIEREPSPVSFLGVAGPVKRRGSAMPENSKRYKESGNEMVRDHSVIQVTLEIL